MGRKSRVTKVGSQIGLTHLQVSRFAESDVDTRKLKQQLQQNDITYVVRRSLVASEQEKRVSFHQ